jgi:hypothetical protein
MTRPRAASLATALLLWSVASATGARAADPATARCEAAYEGVQLQRQRGKLLAARDQAAVCARDVCPEVARRDCARWADELAHDIPSVVVVARDDAERDVPGVILLVDGVERSEAVSGRAFDLDPGAHSFRVVGSNRPPVEETFTIYQGEHDRLIRIALPAQPEPPPSPARPKDLYVASAPPARARGSIVPSFVVAGLSVATLAASAILGVTGRQELSGLRATCAPACTDSQVDPVRTRLTASDVTLVVGLVGSALAVSLFFLRGDF